MTPLTEGIHDIPAPRYNTDDLCALPSLSRSIAKTLLAKTPRHAWYEHPRLNPNYVNVQKKIFDIANAMESLFIDGDANIERVEGDNWKKKATQEARDAAYAAGKTPLLPHEYEQAREAVDAARPQLDVHAEAAGAFTDGTPQQTLIWHEDTPWGLISCRARLDWKPNKGMVFDDYKTTGDANPDVWQRRAFETGCDLQAVFYTRGIRRVLGISNPKFRFIVQETKPPYALSVVELTPGALAMAEAKIHRAIEIWARCLKENSWPGYPSRTCYIEAPPWAEVRFEDEKAREQAIRDDGRDPFKELLDWQAPLEKEEEAA